jgi:aldehyde dehydrogenase (NAD+)
MIENNKFSELFEKQKANQFNIGNTTYKERIKKLNKLKQALEFTYKQELRDAMYADFKKPHLETDLTEIYLAIKEIKHAKRHLKSWTKKQKVETPITLLGTSSWFTYEPKGVCLIISPWNYPILLTFGPLVSAIAAGNTVILKPSEMTPNTSLVLSKMIKDLFPENEVALVQGEVEVSKELLNLPFNHIFFTGSTAVGKIVMKAASKHLTSVTLELGGKSPTIIDETANIKNSIKNIVWGKHLNNGQICITPDYVLIHESKKEAFVSAYKEMVLQYYSEDASNSPSYSRIVNENHFKRLVGYLDDAKEKGATIELGGNYDTTSNYIEPTLITNVPDNALLMNEEIFGPILPIKTYTSLDEAIDFVNSKEKPLSLYIYSKSKKAINTIIKNTRAGGTCINTNELHFSNQHLPFGGSNHSGIGKAHGFYSFQEFSNMRAVLRRYTVGPLHLLFPPYNNFKQKIVDLAIKWF